MIELNVYKNNNALQPQAYNKWYPHVDTKEQINIDGLARHMSEHNSPYSAGCIAGVLKDMVSCIRELTLMGNSVKIDDLAIFKCSVEGNGQPALYQAGANGYGALKAAIGVANKGTKQKPEYTGFAVKSLKLLATACGAYTRDELNRDGKLGWTKAAQIAIDEARSAAEGGDEEP